MYNVFSGIKIKRAECKHKYGGSVGSELAKSMGGGDLVAQPQLERAPLMH